MKPQQPFLGAITLPRLVGRKDILGQIKASLPAKDPRVFYLKGAGGIGKTRLLQEVLQFALTIAHEENLVVPTELVDLYHYSTHSEEGLAHAIYAVLPVECRMFFGEYDDKQREMRGSFQEGDYEHAAEMRKQVLRAFQSGLQSLVKSHCLILAFDTLEVLSHSAPAGEVLQWLSTLLASLEGSALVLLAGRPDTQGEGHIKNILGYRLQVLNVESLVPGEVAEYLEALEEALELQGESRSAERLKAIPVEMREVFAVLTAGRPILIALIADLILGQSSIQEMFLESPETIQSLSADKLQEKQRKAQSEILNHLRNLPSPLRETLDLLSLTRKGMSPDLLAHLQSTYLSVARERLHEMFRFSFIKAHPAYDDRVYLHDEMYDLLEQDSPNPQWRATQIGCIAGWYSEETTKAGAELQKVRESKKTGVVLEDLGQKYHDLQVEEVHYLLRKDPSEGMAHFVELSLDAYFSWDLSWDTHLESEVHEFIWRQGDFPLRRALEWELTLGRVRWDILKGNWSGADASLTELENQASPGPLHVAHREIWRAYFYLQSGQYANAQTAFVRAGHNLHGDAVSEEHRLLMRLQALLCNEQGYMFGLQGKYQIAVEAYQRAIPLLRSLHNEKVLTDVLKNLAFALAELGNTVAAQRLIQDALGKAKQQGARYTEGLCWNTMVLIDIRAGELEKAVASAQKALTLFRDIRNARGIGLTCRSLTEAYRRLALLHKEDPWQQRKEIEEAKKYGEQAVEIFTQEFKEPIREIDALIEAGCAYRDRIRIERESFEVPAEWLRHAPDLSVDKVTEYLQRAAELARDTVPYRVVDVWVNLAMLSLYLEDYSECEKRLYEAEEYVPREYKVQPQGPYPPIGGENPGFWLALGKLYQVRAQALWLQYAKVLSQDNIENIGEWITLSTTYDELFQPQSFGARRGQDDLYGVLKSVSADVLREFYRAAWKATQKYGLRRSKENPQERAPIIKFLEYHFGPSDLHVSRGELETFWEEKG
jgi:tetratricopeptide (TPR) repeat protein